MSDAHAGGLRQVLALEAARLMYQEGVKQYFTAKRIAARKLLGRAEAKRARFRPSDLPSNGEIRAALLELAETAEGDRRHRRLFAMRVVALEALRALAPFDPRLIGSVSTGHVRAGSDIDLHVFVDAAETLMEHLRSLGWVFETERVTLLKFGEVREYLHVHVADVFAVELTVYPRRDLRMRPRSSTDGKPIERFGESALERLLARDHSEAWERFLADGTVDGMDESLAPEEDSDDPDAAQKEPDLHASLLCDEVDDDKLAALLRGDLDEPPEDYAPLAGFEHL